MKRFLALAPLVCLLSAFISCQKPPPPPKPAEDTAVDLIALERQAEAFVPAIGRPGGEIVLSSIADPQSFNPIVADDRATLEITQYLYEGLVHINGVTRLPEPGLAQSWDRSADGLTWTFHIRPGVLWSDSTPFSAADVVFTFNDLVYNSDVGPNVSRDFFTVGGKTIKVKALDTLTVEFALPAPYAPFLRAMSQEILPRHRLAAAVRNRKFGASLGLRTPADSMAGTGPFLLESFVSSQKVVLKRNPRYWKKDGAGNPLPYLDRVVYLIAPGQDGSLERFRNGEIDYLEARGEDYPALKKDAAAGQYAVFRTGPSSGSNFLLFNLNAGADPHTGKSYVDPVKRSWFRDRRFRKAVSYSLDRGAMLQSAMGGMGRPQWSPMSPADGYFFDSTVDRYPCDLTKAKALLAEAGFKDLKGDSVLEDSAGHPVTFTFLTNNGNAARRTIAESICRSFRLLGFRVQLQPVDFGSLMQKIGNPPYEWDAALLGLTGDPEPYFGANVWLSSGALHLWSPRQTKPATSWEAAIDSLFAASLKEPDEGRRRVLYNEWQHIAADELPLIYTVLPERILCVSGKFGNVNPSPAGGLLHNIEYWYVRKP